MNASDGILLYIFLYKDYIILGTIIITLIVAFITTIIKLNKLENIDYELEQLNKNIKDLLINKNNTLNEQDYIKQCENKKIKP